MYIFAYLLKPTSISNKCIKRFIEGNSRKCFERFHFTRWMKAENAERKTEQRKAQYNRAIRYFPHLQSTSFSHTHTDINNFTSFDLLYLDIHPRHFYLNILSERMNNYLFIFVLLHLFKYWERFRRLLKFFVYLLHFNYFFLPFLWTFRRCL